MNNPKTNYDFEHVFETYEQILKQTYNMYIFMIDGLIYAYNFCTSFFYQLTVKFLTSEIDNYTLEKCYYIVKTLNTYRLNKVTYYDFYQNPLTGRIDQTVCRKINHYKICETLHI